MPKSHEGYVPTPDDIKKAKDIMTPTQKKMSEYKESTDIERVKLVEEYNKVRIELGLGDDVDIYWKSGWKWNSSDTDTVEDKSWKRIAGTIDGQKFVMSGSQLIFLSEDIGQGDSLTEVNIYQDCDKKIKNIYIDIENKLMPLAEIGRKIHELDKKIDDDSWIAKREQKKESDDFRAQVREQGETPLEIKHAGDFLVKLHNKIFKK